jgi:flagellar motor switch protein FliM
VVTTTTSRRGRGQSNVVPFDFRRPNKFSRDHVRAFQIVHETFARQLSTVLATTLRAGASSAFDKVEQLTYDEYIRAMPNPSYMVILSLNPLPGAALLQLPLPITFAAIDRLLGGTGDAGSPKRPLTEIEQNLMRSVVDRALRELEYAYETLVRVEAEIVQQEFNPQFAQIAAPSDMVLVVSFEMRIGDKRDTATICVPFTTCPSRRACGSTRSGSRRPRSWRCRSATSFPSTIPSTGRSGSRSTKCCAAKASPDAGASAWRPSWST